MKYFFSFLIGAIIYLQVNAQGTETSVRFSNRYDFIQLYQLDSLGNSNSIAKYFGSLYFTFLQSIEKQLAPADSTAKELVRRFEKTFAGFYIDACEAHEENRPILIKEWQAYFSDPGLQPIQYKLLGTNAHLNGGLWQAMTNSFTREEMDQLKNEFVIFKRSLNQTYKLVYREAVTQNKRSKNLDQMSLGISRRVGNYYLYKWRKRQMRLARLYWSGSPGYSALLKKIDRKKRKIDWLIIHTM